MFVFFWYIATEHDFPEGDMPEGLVDMNWGWVDGSYNGWYGFNNVNVGGNNYEHNRKNLYVNPK